MKIFLSLLLCFIVMEAHSQDSQFVGKYKLFSILKFSDFKKLVPVNDTNDYTSIYLHKIRAETLDFISYNADVISKPNAASHVDIITQYEIISDTLSYYISSFFDPYNSYMIVKDSETLAHEQIHFCICEYYARKIKRQLALISDPNDGIIERLIAQCKVDCDATHNALDEECYVTMDDHPYCYTVDRKWELKMKVKLDALKQYAAPEGYILLKKEPVVHKKTAKGKPTK